MNDIFRLRYSLLETEIYIFVFFLSRERGSLREENEEEKIQRLFVIVPKSMTHSELLEYFKSFGEIDYVSIIKDKETSESKGFGYVKYYKYVTKI